VSVKNRKLRNLKVQIARLKWELESVAKAIPLEDMAIVFGRLEDSRVSIPRPEGHGGHKGLRTIVSGCSGQRLRSKLKRIILSK
jgi:hypothetical protein